MLPAFNRETQVTSPFPTFVYFIGNCTDYTGAYSCTCDPGYSGQNCSIDVDECESSPCINGEYFTFMINCYDLYTVNGLNPGVSVVFFFLPAQLASTSLSNVQD